jgi:Zn-dependent protease with chaperone function
MRWLINSRGHLAMHLRAGLLLIHNVLSSILYAVVSLGVFLSIQGFAVIAPAWATYAATRAYSSELDLAFRPPPPSSDFSEFIQWQQQRSQPPSHAFFIIAIIAGALVTCLVSIKSLQALFYVGFGRLAPGYQLLPANGKAQARLLRIVDSVCATTNVSRFRKIFLTNSANIATLYTAGGRYLVLGVSCLKYLTAQELRALIAHECGHHHNGAMLLSRVHYRTVMLFKAIESVWAIAYKSARKIAKDEDFLTKSMSPIDVLRNNLGGMVNAMAIPLLIGLLVYRVFLQLVGVMIEDPEYEFYCDSVACHFFGGRTFCSALQKMVDLDLAERIAARIQKVRERVYGDLVDEEYEKIRQIEPEIRRQTSAQKVGTHPPLYARFGRAERFLDRPDSSLPILSQAELNELTIDMLSG